MKNTTNGGVTSIKQFSDNNGSRFNGADVNQTGCLSFNILGQDNVNSINAKMVQEIQVFTPMGKLVKTLPGTTNQITWDRTDNLGSKALNGTYIVAYNQKNKINIKNLLVSLK